MLNLFQVNKAIAIITVTLCLITLGSCSIHDGYNSIMPSGYKYNNHEFGSPEGVSPRFNGYQYSPSVNDKSVQIWENIAESLVNRLEQQFNLKPQSLYLQPHMQHNLFVNSYDFALRKEFIKRDYSLTHSPNTPAHLFFAAMPAKNAPKGETPFKLVEFQLYFIRNGAYQMPASMVLEVPGFYNNISTSRTYLKELNKARKQLLKANSNLYAPPAGRVFPPPSPKSSYHLTQKRPLHMYRAPPQSNYPYPAMYSNTYSTQQ